MPKKKIDYREHEEPEECFPDISNVASATECTGLMPRPPLNNQELESFQELSPMEIPKGKEDVRDSVQYKEHHHGKTAKEARESAEEASR